MSSKQKVLWYLEQNRETYRSGEELARQLGISRSGVWKAVQELKKEGYPIDAVTNRGYRLCLSDDLLSAEGITALLEENPYQIHIFQSLASTNSEAKRMAVSGAPTGTVVLAEEQTGGRGRMGRQFYSPKGSGIYMSILLRPNLSAERSLLVTTAASVAVCHAIEAVSGKRCSIKWVNDIYMEHKKVCGILTEAITNFETGTIESIILGIGINFRQAEQDFPEEIRGIAGAVFSQEQKNRTRNQLIAAILKELLELESQLHSGSFLPEYKARSLVLGKTVMLLSAAGKQEAEVFDIDDRGGLVVRYPDGSVDSIHTGEVSVRGLFDGDLQRN